MSLEIHYLCLAIGFLIGTAFSIYIMKYVWKREIKLINQTSANISWGLATVVATSIMVAMISLSAFVMPDIIESIKSKHNGRDTFISILLRGGFFAPFAALIARSIMKTFVEHEKMQDTALYNGKMLTPFLYINFLIASITVFTIGLLNLDDPYGVTMAEKGVLWLSLCIGTYIGFATERVDQSPKEQITSLMKKLKNIFSNSNNIKRMLIVFIPSIAVVILLFVFYYTKSAAIIFDAYIMPGIIMSCVPMLISTLIAARKERNGKVFEKKRNEDISCALKEANGHSRYYNGMKYCVVKDTTRNNEIKVCIFARTIENMAKYKLGSWGVKEANFEVEPSLYIKVSEFLDGIYKTRQDEMNLAKEEIRKEMDKERE